MKTIIAIVVAIIVIVGGWFLYTSYSQSAAPASTTTETGTQSNSTDNSGVTASVGASVSTGTAPMTATVTYTASGFSPSTVTIAKGGTITFVNQGGSPMWVASDPHPVHSGYDGTSREVHCAAGYTGPTPFDQCTAGNSYSFTFTKTGTWGYHNHLGADDTATVIVE